MHTIEESRHWHLGRLLPIVQVKGPRPQGSVLHPRLTGGDQDSHLVCQLPALVEVTGQAAGCSDQRETP